MCEFFGTPGMPTITGQLQRSGGVAAILAAVLAVFRRTAVARGMFALPIFGHLHLLDRGVALKRPSGRPGAPPIADRGIASTRAIEKWRLHRCDSRDRTRQVCRRFHAIGIAHPMNHCSSRTWGTAKSIVCHRNAMVTHMQFVLSAGGSRNGRWSPCFSRITERVCVTSAGIVKRSQ